MNICVILLHNSLKMNHILHNHKKNRKLTTFVENRTKYQSDYAELNIFETREYVEQVHLCFDYPIIASMLTGKKIMHLQDMPAFEFFPGESVVIPSKMGMSIDFPLACEEDPTQCLALVIDDTKINEVVQEFNQKVSIENENNNWNLDQEADHLIHDFDVDALIGRLVYTFTNNNKSQAVLLDLMIQELIVRLLQTKAKSFLLNDKNMIDDTRIGFVINFIKKNLTNKDITVELLAKKACMSTSHFHRKFKNTLGISPIDYINSQKIKFSKKLIMKSKDCRISEIALKSGFNNTSYFNRQFKKMEMMTPQQFKKSILQ